MDNNDTAGFSASSSLATLDNDSAASSSHRISNNNKNNNSNSSYAALMHKQAVEHDNERQQLASVQVQHAQVKQRLEHQQLQVQSQSRTQYLSAARTCHGVELEYIELQAQIRNCGAEHEAIQRECDELEQELADEQAQWEEEIVIMGRQVAKQELYERRLQEKIGLYNETIEMRQKKLDILAAKAQVLVDEKDWKEQQLQACIREMTRLEALEQEKNDNIQMLGQQVRSQLTRRQELRKALYEAQEANRIANEELSEQERMDG